MMEKDISELRGEFLSSDIGAARPQRARAGIAWLTTPINVKFKHKVKYLSIKEDLKSFYLSFDFNKHRTSFFFVVYFLGCYN